MTNKPALPNNAPTESDLINMLSYKNHNVPNEMDLGMLNIVCYMSTIY